MALLLYHGTTRWSGAPEIRPQRGADVEHGPGLYLTTSYQTARRYGRSLVLVALRPDLHWLEEATLPLEVALKAATELFGSRIGRKIGVDLTAYAKRVTFRLGGAKVDAAVLVNLAVNEGAASGARGVALARFLAAHDIDASLARQSSHEDWVIVFNPKVIITVSPVGDRELRTLGFDLPQVAAQQRAPIAIPSKA